jgi:hypothetical protein
MGPSQVVLLTILLLVPVWVLLRRNFIKGLCYGIFLCVVMPVELRIPMPGNLPQLTIYRLVLITLFIFWLRHREPGHRLSSAPLFGAFLFWALANLASLLFTDGNFVISLKRYLDFVLESAVFFLLVMTSLRSREDALAVLRAACLGVAVVGALAFIEKYTAFNPVNYLAPSPDTDVVEPSRWRDVVATYRHRILLGTGMAMGWPLILALMHTTETRSRRRLTPWFALPLIVAGCYFGDSRGPWLAACLAGLVMLVLGRAFIRRRLALILGLAALVLISRPGVVLSLVNAAKVTTDTESEKGGNFRYRLELWKVAWTQISQSPGRLLLGCGPGCGLASTVDWNLSYRNGEGIDIWSWDNQLAYDLYQSGLFGFAASLTLYGGVLFAVFRFWRQAGPEHKNMLACLLASLLAYLFMLTNVMMFAKPVNFLFWTVAATSFSLALYPKAEAVEAAEDPDAEIAGLPSQPEISPTPASP